MLNEPPSKTLPTLLIVDDVPTNVEVLARMFWGKGYNVRIALSGDLALQIMRISKPDLILLDINMPGMSGLEVCAHIKKTPEWRSIPVIFLSAMDDAADKVKAFAAGGVDYVTKPFELIEVEARVETHLKLYRYQQYLESMVQEQVREITEAQMGTIFALAKLAESRDDATGQHLDRVQSCCKLLAEALYGQNDENYPVDMQFVKYMEQASPLHDVGKVGIADAILLKPGKLSTEEFEIMKQHTLIGAKTLAMVQSRYPHNAFISLGIEIARSHHEKWDGSGYPDGLSGEKIPLSARVMAVADVYDALRSKRCYKDAVNHDAALKIILDGSGTQFDSRIVGAFLLVEEKIIAAYE